MLALFIYVAISYFLCGIVALWLIACGLDSVEKLWIFLMWLISPAWLPMLVLQIIYNYFTP